MAPHHPPSTQPLRTPRVVVSIRPWFGKEAERERRQEGLRDAVADGVASLAAAGWETRLISLYWPRDHAEARAIAADPRVASADVRDTELDWAELLAEIEAADLVIAMRYHAVIAASLVRRPTIALAYEPKVASLAAELGIPMVAVDQPRTPSNSGPSSVPFWTADPVASRTRRPSTRYGPDHNSPWIRRSPAPPRPLSAEIDPHEASAAGQGALGRGRLRHPTSS